MKWPDLRPEEGRVAWGGFVWILPILYVFWDPYRTGAGWVEWMLTGAGFVVFLLLYGIALASSRDPRIIARVTLAMTILGVVATAYRPAGALYFGVAAPLAPYGVRGHVLKSLAIIVALIGVMAFEWWLLWPVGFGLPYIIGINMTLAGIGTIVVARQMIALRRAHKATERERIARDLHDILGHTLSVVTLRSELAGRLVDADPARAREEMKVVEHISRDALTEVREAITGYQSGDLTVEAERARSSLEAAGIDAEIRMDGGDVSPELERVLGLALREAVTNVLRHAEARRCRVSFRREDDMYRLRVHDDGRGGTHVEGVGMAGIRARAEALGGQATWVSGLGTELTITIPAVP